jgi:hypothetical protein
MAHANGRDWGFFKWFAVGFLVVFGFITGFSIGLPFLLLGVVLFARLSLRGPEWPADLGLLGGAGAVCLLIAAINLISGDLLPTALASVGVALVGVSTVSFWWLRCRPAVR